MVAPVSWLTLVARRYAADPLLLALAAGGAVWLARRRLRYRAPFEKFEAIARVMGDRCRLWVARVDGRGKLTVVAQVPTREGARNGVVVKDGTVYLAHASTPKSNDLLVVSPTTK